MESMNNIPVSRCSPAVSDTGVSFQDMLFGLNAEITRRGFFGGLSAQMLNNRKLYAGDDAPVGWECLNCERRKAFAAAGL